MTKDKIIAVVGVMVLLIISIFIFFLQKGHITNVISSKETPECILSEYWVLHHEFEKQEYCTIYLKLENFLKCCNEEINSSKTYSYVYFMLGYTYERITLDSKFVDCTSKNSGVMSVSYYNTYLQLNLNKDYRDRAFEGIAKILSQKTDIGQLQLALSIVDKGISEFPDYSNLYRLKGNIFLSLNFPKEAEKQYRIAIEKNPQNTWNYIGLGSSLSLQYKTKDAIEAYNNALILDPNNSIATDLLKRILK